MILRFSCITLLILLGCQHHSFPPSSPTIVGNDRDEHGCIGSAGYTWSLVLHDCIRPFELTTKLYASDSSSFAALAISSKQDTIEVFCMDVAKEQRIFIQVEDRLFKNAQNNLLVKTDSGFTLKTEKSFYQ